MNNSLVINAYDNVVTIKRRDNSNTIDHVPAMVYRITVDDGTLVLIKDRQNFTLPQLRFGAHKRHFQRITASFDRDGNALGVLLIGERGSGKSLMAEEISNWALAQDLPVFIVDKPMPAQFLLMVSQAVGPCVFFFDEFEKVYNEVTDREGLLSFFSDTSLRGTIFLITVNRSEELPGPMWLRPYRRVGIRQRGAWGIGVHPYRFVKEMSSYFLAIAAGLTENDPEHRQWTLNTRKDISPSLEKTANFFGAPWASKHMFLGSSRSRLMLRMRLHNLVYSVQAVPSAFADAEFDDFDDTVLYYPGRRIGSLPDGQLVQFQIESPIQGFSLYSHCEGAPLALDHDSPNEVWQFVMQLMKSAWPQFENIAELFMPLSVDKPWASNQ